MYSFEEIKSVCSFPKSDQCPYGLQFMLEKFASLNPQVFMQVGPGKLWDFNLFKGLCASGGLAIGIDYQVYEEWNEELDEKDPVTSYLIATGSHSDISEDTVKAILSDRKADMLFIDGDHSEELVRNDWNRYSKFVRSGGLVFFHDYDRTAVERDGKREGQGAAIICLELERQGYEIHTIPNTSIGTSYVYIP